MSQTVYSSNAAAASSKPSVGDTSRGVKRDASQISNPQAYIQKPGTSGQRKQLSPLVKHILGNSRQTRISVVYNKDTARDRVTLHIGKGSNVEFARRAFYQHPFVIPHVQKIKDALFARGWKMTSREANGTEVRDNPETVQYMDRHTRKWQEDLYVGRMTQGIVPWRFIERNDEIIPHVIPHGTYEIDRWLSDDDTYEYTLRRLKTGDDKDKGKKKNDKQSGLVEDYHDESSDDEDVNGAPRKQRKRPQNMSRVEWVKYQRDRAERRQERMKERRQMSLTDPDLVFFYIAFEPDDNGNPTAPLYALFPWLSRVDQTLRNIQDAAYLNSHPFVITERLPQKPGDSEQRAELVEYGNMSQRNRTPAQREAIARAKSRAANDPSYNPNHDTALQSHLTNVTPQAQDAANGRGRTDLHYDLQNDQVYASDQNMLLPNMTVPSDQKVANTPAPKTSTDQIKLLEFYLQITAATLNVPMSFNFESLSGNGLRSSGSATHIDTFNTQLNALAGEFSLLGETAYRMLFQQQFSNAYVDAVSVPESVMLDNDNNKDHSKAGASRLMYSRNNANVKIIPPGTSDQQVAQGVQQNTDGQHKRTTINWNNMRLSLNHSPIVNHDALLNAMREHIFEPRTAHEAVARTVGLPEHAINHHSVETYNKHHMTLPEKVAYDQKIEEREFHANEQAKAREHQARHANKQMTEQHKHADKHQKTDIKAKADQQKTAHKQAQEMAKTNDNNASGGGESVGKKPEAKSGGDTAKKAENERVNAKK